MLVKLRNLVFFFFCKVPSTKPVRLSVCLLSVCPSVFLSVCLLSVRLCPSVCLYAKLRIIILTLNYLFIFKSKVKDVELSPVVNRDLSRRVRVVTGATTAKQVIRDDIKLAAKLIRVLDKRAALYEKESREETEAREKAEKEAAEVCWDWQSHTVT